MIKKVLITAGAISIAAAAPSFAATADASIVGDTEIGAVATVLSGWLSGQAAYLMMLVAVLFGLIMSIRSQSFQPIAFSLAFVFALNYAPDVFQQVSGVSAHVSFIDQADISTLDLNY